MSHLPRRTAHSGPTPVRLLSRLIHVDAAEPTSSLSHQLSQWLGWTDAIALSAALTSHPVPGSSLPPRPGNAEARDAVRVRAALANAIVDDGTSSARRRGPGRPAVPAESPDATVDFAVYRHRYLTTQQTMATEIGILRGRLRKALTARQPAMAKLAMVDTVTGARGRCTRAEPAGERAGAVGNPFRALAPSSMSMRPAPGLTQFRKTCRLSCWPNWTSVLNRSKGCSPPCALANCIDMNRILPHIVAFVAGLAVVCWIGAGYAGANALALAVTLVIGAFYVTGAFELQCYRQATASLAHAVSNLSERPAGLGQWLDTLPAGLRDAVRLRVEGERVTLPAPTLTPYLVGLLVLLGMFGTFLGMVATLRGTGMALEGATDLQAMRASLAAPVKGLGFAFGTSVAGVADVGDAGPDRGAVSARAHRSRAATRHPHRHHAAPVLAQPSAR